MKAVILLLFYIYTQNKAEFDPLNNYEYEYAYKKRKFPSYKDPIRAHITE